MSQHWTEFQRHEEIHKLKYISFCMIEGGSTFFMSLINIHYARFYADGGRRD